MHTTLAADPVFEQLAPILQGITDRRPVIVEIGVHVGQSTPLLWALCRTPPIWIGFEPDPRNLHFLAGLGLRVIPAAVGASHGTTTLYMSSGGDDGNHTASSSIQRPTAHLEHHPHVTFPETAEVQVCALDDVIPSQVDIDLIWCDVQGAQRAVIAGGQKTLARTRYLYIEVHGTPMYDGEPTPEELLELLPDWEVVGVYAAEVLLRRKGATP